MVVGDAGFVVLVYCSECDTFISEEDGHSCQLAPAYAHERNAARAAKLRELFTDEQARQLIAEADERMGRVRRARARDEGRDR